MNPRIPYPLIRLFLAFIAGLAFAQTLGVEIHIPYWIFLIILLLTAFYVFYMARRITFKSRWIFGVFISLSFGFLGYAYPQLYSGSAEFSQKVSPDSTGKYSLLRITAPVQERSNSIRAEACFILTFDEGRVEECDGNILLYMTPDALQKKPSYGDILLVEISPAEVDPPANPSEFDYRRYLAGKGIRHRAFVGKGKCFSMGLNYANPVYQSAYRTRDYLLEVLKDGGLKNKELAVSAALLVGYKDLLDADLRQDYSGTGAMHILSVSGLHVGLIYVIINGLLFFMDRRSWGRLLKPLMVILLIWCYALITGLSPSVMRASAMFSLMLISKMISRDSNIYNSIAASAFLLLLINPHFLSDTGFQLSYLAVLGIVSLQPAMAAWWRPRWWLLRQIWGILTVSVAATLATFPLCIYYFHQFPNYFVLTNLLALPLSTLVMYLGVATLGVSFYPDFSHLLAQGLSWLVLALNSIIGFIEGLPGSVSKGLYLGVRDLALLYLGLLCASVFFFKRIRVLMWTALAAFFLLAVSVFWRELERNGQHCMTIYSVNKHSAIDFVDGETRYLISDRGFWSDKSLIDYHTGGWMAGLGIRDFRGADMDDHQLQWLNWQGKREGNFICWHGFRVAVIESMPESDSCIQVDFLVIRKNPRLKISEVSKCIKPKLIIIDASNTFWNSRRWTEECRKSGLPCWPVRDSGAYVLSFNAR